MEDNFEVGASPEHNMLVGEVQRIRKEVADALKNHIDHLKPLDREIFIKAYVDDIPYKVIAAETGLTETAARKRAFDIKNRIRHRLPEITPWKVSDMVLYKLTKKPRTPLPMLISAEKLLLRLYPQYVISNINDDDIDTMIEHQNLVAVHELLRSHLEMCFDNYINKAHDCSDIYSELREELLRRGREFKEDDRLDSNMFIIKDDLDLVVCGPGNPVLYIGFIHEFITIHTAGTSASSIADYLDDLHSILDIAGDEIDSLIDIRS